MLPVSEAFLKALRGSHGVVSTVTLCDPPGQVGVAPTGRVLAVTGGTVTLDDTADIRGSLDCEVVEAWPDALTATELTPYGAEVFVSRGVSLGGGGIQRVPLGYYRLSNVEQADATAGPLQLTGQDRMAGIVDAKFTQPVQYNATTSFGAVVTAVVEEVYPDAVIEWDDDTHSEDIGRAITGEEDRYGFLFDLVRSAGKIMFFDYRGHLVIKDSPVFGDPVWTVDAGPNGVLTNVGRARSREGINNGIVASGEALDDTPPVRALVVDDDPDSPTYWDGPFGKVPGFFNSPLLTTEDRCERAARSVLRHSQGVPETVDFSAIPNPALEPFDPIEVVFPSVPGRTSRREVHVLGQVRIPLAPGGALTASTRKVQEDEV